MILGFITFIIPFLYIELLFFWKTLKRDPEVLLGLLGRGRRGGGHFIPSREITKIGSLFQESTNKPFIISWPWFF